MMQVGRILIPALVGTSAMTLFSYLISNTNNKNFREPEILGQLIVRLPKNVSIDYAQIAGWFMHYAIGTIFMVFYYVMWKHKIIKPTLTGGYKRTCWYHCLEGYVWSAYQSVSKQSKSLFWSSILALVVFGIFCAITYKLNADKNYWSLWIPFLVFRPVFIQD